MSTTELMQMGRRDVKETDAALLRSERLVNDTIAIGIQTGETLDQQTKQLEKVRAGRGAAARAAAAARGLASQEPRKGAAAHGHTAELPGCSRCTGCAGHCPLPVARAR